MQTELGAAKPAAPIAPSVLGRTAAAPELQTPRVVRPVDVWYPTLEPEAN